MKTMKKSIVLVVTILLSFVSYSFAQTSESQQRNRDIKIAEGILSEIFGAPSSSANVYLPGLDSRSVRGEYVPGYGVHFTISSGLSNFLHIRNLSGGENEQIRVEVQNGNSSSENSSDTDEIREQINEYMTKYASLISGLSDDETIRVTYAKNRNESVRWIFVQDDERRVETQPGLSVWAKVSDLNAFRNGNISEQELMNRINSHELNGDETYKDFNVFASVLETALNSTGNENLRVNRKPQMEYLPGLGVRYKIPVSARPSIMFEEFRFSDADFEFRMDSLEMNLDQSLRLVEESLNPLILKLDSVIDLDISEEELDDIKRDLQEHRQEIRIHQDSLRNSRGTTYAFRTSTDEDVDLEGEAEVIMDELLSVIQNYGSTLSSLDNDELLMISVNWSSRSDDLPERTEIRIRKSDLLGRDDPDIEEIERR